MVKLKSSEEIKIMQAGGEILAQVLRDLAEVTKPGITTNALDRLARELIAKHPGATPSFLGYTPGGARGNKFPAALCVSVNDEIIHGLPSERVVKNGDLVSLDLGVYYQGYHTDSALTVAVGQVNQSAQKLLEVTRESLAIGIVEAVPGKTLGDIGHAIQNYVEEFGFSVIKDFAGHGIGKGIHEPPTVLNFGRPGEGEILKPGMVIAIEPMVVAGKITPMQKADGWTYATTDGSLAAHFEHTVAVIESGALILTE